MTFRVQGRDPNIFKARYFENGLRYRFSFNRAPSPSPTLHKSCTKFTWRIYALSERLLVMLKWSTRSGVSAFLVTSYIWFNRNHRERRSRMFTTTARSVPLISTLRTLFMPVYCSPTTADWSKDRMHSAGGWIESTRRC